MKTSEFDFDLPSELIAQTPLLNRSESRLMILNKDKETITHHHFFEIINYLHEGDVLVRNNTKVIPARLFGTKLETNAHVELLILKHEGDICECLVGNARVVKKGTIVSFGDGKLKAECIEVKDEGIRIFKMIYQGIFLEILDELGTMPLPPYIKEKLSDKDRYQTVYAKVEGSAAAPTAGFHFTEELIEKLKDKGVKIVDITLHIGLGTFRPMSTEDIKEHKMHEEFYSISQEACDELNLAKKEGRRIICVGTTSVRTLETVLSKHDTFVPSSGYTNIFIYPPYKFKAVDALITNFHLPKSTLIMLVSAFAGKDYIFKAYEEAIKERYRFFSFGDSMFIY
ncbi:TPA: tRNA preQ1(34) S-adenosylmethionine ribosyltransferase-isomerase QueA [bacterium]|jgi:S-adenosylmethionine:tRNA ribosyltransferase-isomerase|nr:tRNA preQ1(34) S-adenosylmethionine ribosyltransferase-isomerase QueA [bacterium]